MTHKKLAWATAVKIWNKQNAWADDMYALPKKAGQYYQDIVEIIAEHGGGPATFAPMPPVPAVMPEVDIFGIPLAPGPKEPNSLIDKYAKGEIPLPQFELKPGQSNATGTESFQFGKLEKNLPPGKGYK